MSEIQPIAWRGDLMTGHVEMLDQRHLPHEEILNRYDTADEVAEAIRAMVIRGAPAIGIAAAMGLVLGARSIQTESVDDFVARLQVVSEQLAATRPTAVNLFWALERMARRVESLRDRSLDEIRAAMLAEAKAIQAEDIAMNRAMGQHGASLMPQGARILTHCNTGGLATGGYGTALGVIRACHERDGDAMHVWVDETRPYLQGARLTAWECIKDGIPATLITDSMAGYFMQQGKVDAIITGADRIVANGDAANKIGTYSLAVLCKAHGIPFYVAAPSSTFDPNAASAEDIPIEERDGREITHIGDQQIAPSVDTFNPAFDITPGELITAFVTEKGILRDGWTDAI